MGRRRVTHELITNEAIRRVTFKKRKGGLLKKLTELTVLCGIPACAIIYSAYNDQPDVWPNRSQVRSLLDRLHQLPIEKQTKHMLDQPTFLRQSISKASKDVEKQQRRNYCLRLGLIASGCESDCDDENRCDQKIDDADYSEELLTAARILQQRIEFVDAHIMAAKSSSSEDYNDDQMSE